MRHGFPAGARGPHVTGGTRTTRTEADRPSPENADRPSPENAVTRDEQLSMALRKAVQSTSAYGGVAYLRSPDRRSLVLAAVAGVPLPVLSGFRRIPVASPLPAAEAYRTGRTVSLSGAEETMRRFPRLAVGLPYAFASACAPVSGGGEVLGVLSVLWPSSDVGVPVAARRHLRAAANRLGASLAGLAAAGLPVEAAGQPLVVELPGPVGPAVRVGLFDWDLTTGTVSADEGLCDILGVAPAEFDGRAGAVARLIAPADLPQLRAGVLAAARTGSLATQSLRVRDAYGRYRAVKIWGRVPTGPARSHLIGAVLDTTAGAAAVAAVERLRDGVFSLDPEGRVDYANRSLELLLDTPREQLHGRHPWDVLPWLADPAYEDRYRAAMVSQRPTAFLARRPPDQWLTFSLYPDAHGITGRVVPSAPPREPGAAANPDAGRAETDPAVAAPDRAGPGAMYHLLQLASVLTEAISVREVCDAVADQILPGFGGQELAIYLVRSGRMFLVAQSGYPDGFLDGFEGTPLRDRLPGTDALSSATPIFFEDEHQLLAAYPGIPLDEMRAWAFLPLIASGNPVGTCILGFDEPRLFTPEERSVLTALGGLIAQALERARLYDAEFALARGLQQALLPHRLPAVPGLSIAARYLPGTQGMEIGGDWYDAIVTAQGLCLIIGDVEGHSVGAAATMGQLRSAVRAFATGGSTPEEVLLRTNQLLVDLDPGLLASCCLIRLNPANGRAHAVRAGHVPPLLRYPDGHTEILELDGGALLGVDPFSEYPVNEILLPRGSVLALYTDGLVEESGSGIDQGIEHLRASLSHAADGSLEALADRLLGDVRHSAHRADDVALLLISRT